MKKSTYAVFGLGAFAFRPVELKQESLDGLFLRKPQKLRYSFYGLGAGGVDFLKGKLLFF